MKSEKLILSIIFLLPVFISLVSCSDINEIEKNNGNLDSSKEIPDNRFWDMDVTMTSKGKVTAKYNAGYVERFDQGFSNLAFCDIDSGLVLRFYKKEVENGVLRSNKGTIDEKKGLFTAIEDVEFTSPEGYKLISSELNWDRKKATIFTDSNVVFIRSKKDTLWGAGFISDENGENWEVKNARAKTIVEEKEIK